MMAPAEDATNAQKPDKLPKLHQEKPILPDTSVPKRPRLAPKPSVIVSEPSVVPPALTEDKSDADFSPGHAPGYIQWRRAPVLDLTNETEEQKRHRLNKRHAPKSKRGNRCIDDGTIDRSPALIGKPDPSKLIICFKTEETDEYTNEIIKSDVRHEYEDDEKGVKVDWDNSKSIQALNNWRSQVIRRAIGKAYDSKEFWTVQEQKIITGIVLDYLNAGKDIDWRQIAHEYNSLTRDIAQDEGTPGATRRYRCQGNDKAPREAITISMPLREHRYIPQRSEWVLRREMGYFLAPDAIAAMNRLRSSSRPERNGHPPVRSNQEEKQVTRQAKGEAVTQESSEQEDSFISSTYDNDRSILNSPFETTPDPPSLPLTHPRPLQPRPVVIPQPIAEPPPRRYKKRTVYNEEIVYDEPSSELNRPPISSSAIQTMGGRQQALDTLAEQATIMYNHLPETKKWTAPRPIAPALINFRPSFAASDPSRSISFEQITSSPAASLNDESPVRASAARTLSANLTQRRKLPSGRGQHPVSSPSTPYAPPAGATMVPILAVHRRLQDEAAVKAAVDAADAADANAKKSAPSEPILEL
ncbi:hypothetical protein SBOR_1781 [Sclerotinia borealis F-4128]|uniref:Uncharacterized protein n=1 Tax=Sclerotinia borealis (strain F-4128) TaxID=1432307 RepID=W9CPT2_SCLBF|nr:hypothetical protein SBOR_1781 [Sclerotinia borealis F-4128]